MGYVMRVRGGKAMDDDGDEMRVSHADGNRGGLSELHAHGKSVRAHVRPVIRIPDPRKGGYRTSAAGKTC